MRESGALIGGEGNGGVIDPRVGWVRDPFIGMGLILSLMAETDKPLSQLAAELPRYTMVKDKYELPREKLPAAFAALRTALAGRDRQRQSTACGWTGPTGGCTFAAATPSRWCG